MWSEEGMESQWAPVTESHEIGLVLPGTQLEQLVRL